MCFWVRLLPVTLALPATASVIGGFLSAWRIEKTLHGTPWTFRNKVLQNLGISALMAAAIRKFFGPRALTLFFVQSAMAITMLGRFLRGCI